MRAKTLLTGAALILLLAACGGSEPQSAGGPAAMRRLTEDQYRQSIADIFGADIKVAGRFEPEIRDGLLAVGTSQVTVSRAGFEQYYTMARNVAAQAVDEKHRDQIVGCKPADVKAADDACAGEFLARIGRSVLRRPLTQEEVAARVAVAANATRTRGDFYAGLEFALSGLLAAPEFLFRLDGTRSDAAGKLVLDPYAKAARLSFLLWNSTPDGELLAAAEKGELDDPKGLAKQVERLLASARVEAGVRAFFADFLGFDTFATLEKDPIIYPAFMPRVARDAREQTLRTVVDHLLVRRADYRDLFTTRRTFMTRSLGAVYRMPVESRDGWDEVEFGPKDPRVGIQSQLSFTALHAHPGRSSPTLRGKAIRELLLCQTVPAPPNNVNFAIVQDTSNQEHRTARDRLTAHSTDPTCAGCHKIIDPIGLTLESFDGAGQMRADENGAPIDLSGEMDGRNFDGARGLGQALHDSEAAQHCLVDSLYKYAVGRTVAAEEKPWIEWLNSRFAADGYRLPDLLRRIALSPAFYAVSEPLPKTTPATPAAEPKKEAKL